MRESKKHNKGYSLVEMIIVIAILLVVSAMGMITFNMVKNARVRDAAARFDSLISETIQKSKNMIEQPYTYKLASAGSQSTSWFNNYNYYSTGYYIEFYYNYDEECWYSNFGGLYYIHDESNATKKQNNDNGLRIVFLGPLKKSEWKELSSECKIVFTPEQGSLQYFDGDKSAFKRDYSDKQVFNTFDADKIVQSVDTTSSTFAIYFNKRGECVHGAGTYSFQKADGTELAKVIIRQNGSHVVK